MRTFREMLGIDRSMAKQLPYRIQDIAGQYPGYAALLIGLEATSPGSLNRLRIQNLKDGNVPLDIKNKLFDIGAAFGFGNEAIRINNETNVFQYLARRADDAFPNAQANMTVGAYIAAGQPTPIKQILTDEQQKQIVAARAQAQKTAQASGMGKA